MRSRLLVLAALVFVLVLVVFHQLAFTDLILARGDTYAYFYPYWDSRNAAFRAGAWPLWTPDLFMGAPLLANPQLGTFYPPNWLTTPFAAPDAVRYSILAHVFLAGIGAMLLFWHSVRAQRAPALLAGLIFAFSGFMGAHVEQINQLQGLAWMPWVMLSFHQVLQGERHGLWALLMAMAWALQIFSGHTQTVFMTGVALGLYALYHTGRSRRMGLRMLSPLVGLLLITVMTILLALPQVLPTLELAGMSNRGGGLTPQEATAFSLPPTYIGRALLPSYDAVLFGEYVGYVGVIALGLALIAGLWQAQPGDPSSDVPRIHTKWVWVLIALVGLIFAFGRFTPIYWELARLPGFNSFRVPARWLALFTLGVSMLAGMGLVVLRARGVGWRRLGLVCALLVGLMLVGRWVPLLPVDVAGSAVATQRTLLGWGVALGVFAVLLSLTPPLNSRPVNRQGRPTPVSRLRSHAISTARPHVGGLLVMVVAIELVAASRVLPYNDLVPPEVYDGQRFTISQMLAYGDAQTPPGRVLSIGNYLFDPGDRAALRARYEKLGMSEAAIQTAFTAIKRGEMLAPNLPLTWGIPGVDGFGGGLLPTVYYSQFTALMLPDGTPRTLDGRLGELMAQEACRGACLPAPKWLRLTDTRYLITDKIFDVVHEGVRYDTALAPYWSAPRRLTLSDFVPGDWAGYDQMRILHAGDLGFNADRIAIEDGLSVTILDRDAAQGAINGETVLAITLVDSRVEDVFHEMQPPGFERVLSSDIKIYRLTDEPPSRQSRAYLSSLNRYEADDWAGHEAALRLLAHEASPLLAHTVIHGDAPDLNGPAAEAVGWRSRTDAVIDFAEYTPTRVVITLAGVPHNTYLVLNDAHYPGWQATVNGAATPIYRANVMFRAVAVPAGTSTVVFDFVPTLWYGAMAAGAVVWAISGVLVLGLWRRSAGA